jgi:hypothetical protein
MGKRADRRLHMVVGLLLAQATALNKAAPKMQTMAMLGLHVIAWAELRKQCHTQLRTLLPGLEAVCLDHIRTIAN